MPQPARTVKERPPYAIASVDHALRLAALLQLEGLVTVTDAAAHLGVAPSTAHRLLAMLVYRDFATREGRGYRVGPVLASVGRAQGGTGRLRTAALPRMVRLMETFEETATLTVRTGRLVRFVAEVECERTLRVGHRTGMVFPAHRTSGGLALLAELSDDAVEELYDQAADDEEKPDLALLLTRLASVREQGFALNKGLSERGVLAIGHAVHGADGVAVASLGLAMPASRFEPRLVRPMVAALRAGAREIQARLAEEQH
ncbi:IclR family transcriptional regulator [Propioniciclava soli]|uniref:IclR family transcriptional regulator n=1 Tax=Propioniciclava soli TaxID=2775081 RepID=UPI001E4E3647|nr:IclR family transcriptional regulator [Propioniciclava soli]